MYYSCIVPTAGGHSFWGPKHTVYYRIFYYVAILTFTKYILCNDELRVN